MTTHSEKKIELYRCTECGKISVSLGWLHGHIEKHRPIWRFWQSGSPGFLKDRTEVITVTEYDVELMEYHDGQIQQY